MYALIIYNNARFRSDFISREKKKLSSDIELIKITLDNNAPLAWLGKFILRTKPSAYYYTFLISGLMI